MARTPKSEALQQLAADRAAGVKKFQKVYAVEWGVSVGTANAWIRSAAVVEATESELNSTESVAESELNRTESAVESGLNRAELTELVTEFSAKIDLISTQLDALLGVAQFLASPNSLLSKEKNSSSLRSEEARGTEFNLNSKTESELNSETELKLNPPTERPAAPKKARARKSPSTPCPTTLTSEELARVSAWGAKQEPRIESSQLTSAWERVRLWAKSGDHRRVDWVSTFMSALSKGWCLRDGSKTDKPAPARGIFDWDNYQQPEGATS